MTHLHILTKTPEEKSWWKKAGIIAIKKGARLGLKTTVLAGEYFMESLAVPAAMVSPVYGGTIPERVRESYGLALKIMSEVIGAYIHNTAVPIRDFVNNSFLEIVHGMDSAIEHIHEDPEKVIYAAIATYLTGIGVPAVTRSFRSWIKTRRAVKEALAKRDNRAGHSLEEIAREG